MKSKKSERNNSNHLISLALISFSRFNLKNLFSSFTTQLVVVTLFALLLRTYNLNLLPVAFTHDESFYPVQAMSLLYSKYDQTGTWSPTITSPSHALYAELPGVVMIPAHYLFRSNHVLASRMTSAVLGSLTVLLIMLISFQLFSNKQAAIFSGLFATFNPWLFQISRQSFDSLFTTFFYLLGIFSFLKLKGRWKLFALIPFVFGFFQYQGGKILFLPIIICLVVFELARLHSRGQLTLARKINLGLFFAACTLLVVWYGSRLMSTTAVRRTNDIILFNQTAITEQVNNYRRQSLDNPLSSLFINKATVMTQMIIRRYLETWDLVHLFVFGEPIHNPTITWTHGLFYLFDVVLFLFGLLMTFRNRSWNLPGLLIISLLLIAPLPQAINTNIIWIYLRLVFAAPLFMILAGLGMYGLWRIKVGKQFVRYALISIYVVSIVNFGYQYFIQAPVYDTGNVHFAERLLANYIKRVNPREVHVLADESDFIFNSLLIYKNDISKNSIADIQSAYQNKNYHLNNYSVDTACLPDLQQDNSTYITDKSVMKCQGGQETEANDDVQNAAIRSPFSGDKVFSIYNDTLCTGEQIAANPKVSYSSLDVEKLSNADFCHYFITSFN